MYNIGHGLVRFFYFYFSFSSLSSSMQHMFTEHLLTMFNTVWGAGGQCEWNRLGDALKELSMESVPASITCLLHSPSSYLLLPEIKSSLRFKISTCDLCHLSGISAFEFSLTSILIPSGWMFQNLSHCSLDFVCFPFPYILFASNLDLWPSWISHANPEIQQYIHFIRSSLYLKW